MSGAALLFLLVVAGVCGVAGVSQADDDRTTGEVTSRPALMRWSFWMPPERLAEFAQEFEARGAPVLHRHGLTAAADPQDRARPDSVYSWYFVDEGEGTLKAASAVWGDPEWSALQQEWQIAFAGKPTGQIETNLTPYWSPAGPGTTVPMGPGRTMPAGEGRGHWKSFDVLDGLASIDVGYNIFEDSRGDLWFASYGSGVTRYDGETFTTYTTRDGLIGLDVRQILEDRRGGVWFRPGAHHICRGVSRFDGKGFTSLTTADGLPYRWVRAMAEGADGAMWFGTQEGLARYDGEAMETFGVESGLVSNRVEHLLADRSGRLWVGTRLGLNWFSGEEDAFFETVGALEGKRITRLLEGRDGHIWCGTVDGEVGRYDGRSWTLFTSAENHLQGPVYVLHSDRKGHLWAASGHLRLSRYDGREWRDLSDEAGLSDTRRIGWIGEDRLGQLWVGTLDGALRWDGESFALITTEDGLANNIITSIFEDRRGRLWFGTLGGLSRYDREFVTLIGEDGVGHGLVSTLVWGPQGNLWIGARAGLTRYDGTSFTTFTTDDGLAGDMISCLAFDSQDRLWIGTTAGVSCYDGESITTYGPADGLVGRLIRNIVAADAGDVWLNVGWGAVRYDGESFASFARADGMVREGVNAMCLDRDGDMWFGHDEGTSRYDGETIASFTPADGLVEQSISAIFQDRDGDMWFGSDGYGVSRFDGERFTTYTTDDGLAHEALRVIAQDREGHMWFGTDGGVVSRYDGVVFQTLSRADGLNGQSIRCIAQGPDGDHWFATYSGVIRYRPPPPVPPQVFIDAVVAHRRYTDPTEIAIPSTADLVAFEFHGSSFNSDPSQLVYVFRLVGVDGDWRTTRERRVEYPDLLPGRYRFEIKSVDRDLEYSEAPATVELEVFYQPSLGALALEDLHVEDLFASFYREYADRPVGSVRVVNSDVDTIEATLTWRLTDWTRRAMEQPLRLPPGSSREIQLTTTLDASILDLEQRSTAAAEVSVSFAAGEQTISVAKEKEMTVHPRGAMRWDAVARAAAFVTPDDPAVASMARGTLVAFGEESRNLGRPGHNWLQAMALFEALREHGVRYLVDANTPYNRLRTDREAIDHIQYPAQVLAGKAGDCDDLTVLYCSLLESAGIPTALVDSPGHIFPLFDSGVLRWEAYKLPVDPRLYVVRDDRLWIPVEITLLNDPFHEAWRAGADELAQLTGVEQRRLIIDTAQAWQSHPPSAPAFGTEVQAPTGPALSKAVQSQHAVLSEMIKARIGVAYLDPMKAAPDDNALRTRLLRVYVALTQYDAAISAGLDFLIDDRGDRSATYNHLGIAHYLKGDTKQAAFYFQQALDLSPLDEGIRRNHEQAMWALGRSEEFAGAVATTPADAPLKGAAGRIDEDSFYWIE